MGNRNALLIGSAEYLDATLPATPGSVLDVKEFGGVLKDPELGAFNVISMVNLDVQAARLAIARFFMNCREIDDVNLLYYSGHGILNDNGQLFLAFRDSQMEMIAATCLSGQFILDEISRRGSKSNVIILDCSFAGAILRRSATPSDVVILASTSAVGAHTGGYSPAGEGQAVARNGFTAGLIEGLRSGLADLDGDGIVTFNELFLYARRSVEAAAEGPRPQSPRIYDLTEVPVSAGGAARPIFLSYSHPDSEFASVLADQLRDAGHRVWMDTSGIAGGDDWGERIGAAIEASKLMLVVLSPESLKSTWVRRELSYADNMRKPILPVVYMACEIPTWYELQFGQIQRLNLTGQANAVIRESLLSSVKHALRTPTV